MRKLFSDFADNSTHDASVMSALTALNLPVINTSGPLPSNVDKSPEDRSFVTSHLVPFNTNFVAQVLTCGDSNTPKIRFIL